MVKSVLIYRVETWCLCEDDRRRIDATEMDALRGSARNSKLDRKMNEYIRGKMDVQDVILDDITRKQLIWYGHVERMDPMRLPKIMIHWTAMYEKISKNGPMKQLKAMEYGSRKASSDVLKPHNIYMYKLLLHISLLGVL
jgi:hypothetical protein